MRISDFRKAGHTPSLVAAFLYFDVSFMAWVLLGPLGPFIAETYKLSATQKGFLVALPLCMAKVRQDRPPLVNKPGVRRENQIGQSSYRR